MIDLGDGLLRIVVGPKGSQTELALDAAALLEWWQAKWAELKQGPDAPRKMRDEFIGRVEALTGYRLNGLQAERLMHHLPAAIDEAKKKPACG